MPRPCYLRQASDLTGVSQRVLWDAVMHQKLPARRLSGFAVDGDDADLLAGEIKRLDRGHDATRGVSRSRISSAST